MNAKIKLRRKPRADGKFPVVLRVTNRNKSKVIYLGIYCRIEDWNEKQNCFKSQFKQENLFLMHFQNKANKIILQSLSNDTHLSINEFEQRFRGRAKSNQSNAIQFFEELVDELLQANSIGNAKTYKDTIKKLVDYAGKSISFEQINVEFLEKWEAYLRGAGYNEGGLSVRYRTLRSMINKAIQRDIIDQSLYPFKKFKVSKFKSNPEKIALSMESFQKLKEVDLSKHPQLQTAYDLFMFSFYCAGINFVDITKLKKEDIIGSRLRYRRSKTGKVYNLALSDLAQRIVEKYKGLPPYNTDYVFPILLKNKLSEKQIYHRRGNYHKRYNLKLKRIGKLAGIHEKLTANVARHTMATLLKHSGSSIEIISELMGHSSVKVTMEYLKAFDLDVLDHEIEKLEKF